MHALPPVHLVIMQPVGYVHALGFLDQARYVRWQLRRFGAEVTMAKNRLREDALNIVFGAHLGFPPELRERHACIFFNLEQLGAGGAAVRPEYLALLRHSAVADYDARNVAAYSGDASEVPVLPLLHAPYLRRADAPALHERPIDLLFFGSINERRRAFIERVERCGAEVSVFDRPLYGPERDHFILQSKAVLNCHYYDSSRFEQARTALCLSLGTPVISERSAATVVDTDFEDCVTWVRGDEIESFFRERFATPAFFTEARHQLDAWTRGDPVDAYAELMAFGAGFFGEHARRRPAGTWQPARINLGSGKDYKPGWLNLDILDRTEPDLVLDLSRPLALPLERPTRHGGTVRLEAGGVEHIYANNVLEHVPDLPALMTNALALLREGGELEIEVPYEKAPTAWQDPTHVRAMNENSWLYYTDWFWYLGWFEHRFEIARQGWLDARLAPCAREDAAFMQVTLRKIATSPFERTVARTLRPDFGGIEDDEDAPHAADAAEPDAQAAPLSTMES